MTISDAWHFVEDGKKAGPFTEAELVGFIRQGRVGSATLVWFDGMTDWMPLHLSKGAPLLLAAEGANSAAPPAVPGGYSWEGDAAGGEQGPGAPMGFFEAIASCFGKYVQFSGRASRSEYWYFILFYLICSFVAQLVSIGAGMGMHSGEDLLPGLVSLGFLLPSLSVFVRRLHDTDRSGWWWWLFLIPLIGAIVLLVFLCQRPAPGRNRFG